MSWEPINVTEEGSYRGIWPPLLPVRVLIWLRLCSASVVLFKCFRKGKGRVSLWPSTNYTGKAGRLPQYANFIFRIFPYYGIGFSNLFLQYFQNVSIPWKICNFSIEYPKYFSLFFVVLFTVILSWSLTLIPYSLDIMDKTLFAKFDACFTSPLLSNWPITFSSVTANLYRVALMFMFVAKIWKWNSLFANCPN